MDFSSALEWWEEWQLRVLVLGSLGVQFFLAIFGGRRKFSTPPWYRLFLWLFYLASDALAIYALAALFNRRKKVQHNNGGHDHEHDLEVVWAPILLIHLGGQIFITAYNIEDNELWRRHILTAVSQVTVALYVFCKSWSPSPDRNLLAAMVLLFIIGVLKCFTKPIALKAASFNNLVSTSGRAQRTEATSTENELESFIEKARALMAVQGTTDYRIAFKEKIEDDEKLLPPKQKLSMPTKLFVDFACPYSDRLADLEFFYALDWDKAYKRINVGISNIFDLLYTRDILTELNDFVLCCCACTWMLAVVLAIVAIVLLHISHKHAYNHYDVIVTFMLVYGTLLLDILSFFILALYTDWLADDVAQQSLIGFFTRNKRHTWLISVAECLQCKGLLDEYWCMTPCAMSKRITHLAFEHVRDGWTKYIHDAESYRRFNDNLGQWALERAECGELLGWSLEKPFDEIVLIWHVATDFCYHMSSSIYNPSGRAISNYMMHLLFANPEMLMAGSRRNLFTTAYSELEEILQSEENLPLDDEKKLTLTIIDKVKSKEDCFIHDAWLLAEGLMGLDDKDKMWYLIRDVWVEMLCFSAGRCRGYLHAKSLGSGVEHLSYVWLMLAHSGMETFSERLQRRRQLRLPKKEPQNIEDGDAGPSDSRELKPSNLKEEDVHAPPGISQGAESREEKQNHATPSAPQGEGSTVAELNEIKVVPP